MFFSGEGVNFGVAFLAGMVTFIAPCVLPILPAYLAYISGVSLQKGQPSKDDRRRLFTNSLSFVLGFLIIFVLLGIGATWIGIWLNHYRHIIQIFGGVLFIIVGLHVAGLFESRFFARYVKINVQQRLTRWQHLNSFLIGLTFGFSWTPCIGPVLAVILYWASRSQTFWQGFFLLLSFGLGLGLPFLLLGLGSGRLLQWLRSKGKLFRNLQILAGLIMILMGVLLIGDWLGILVRPLAGFGSLELWFYRL